MFLLTDFGSADEFAGVVRAVLQREAPGCPVVDITHEIPPFDLRAGALALERTVPHLGPGVVLAVVDPGVGTSRRAVAVSVDSLGGPSHLLGPDNGLLCFALDALGGATGAVGIPPAKVSAGFGATFDARDRFAPAAASLWRGASPSDIGEVIDLATLVRLEPPLLRTAEGAIEAEVLWVDRFGNVQLAARPLDAERAGIGAEALVVTSLAVLVARRSDTFEGIADDSIGLVVDSNGHLALVCSQRSAATVLGVAPGDVVTVRNSATVVPRSRRGPATGAGPGISDKAGR